ncbi:Sas10 C-terminal domain-containing protein [Lipomyces tetrasporus]|uniref:Sas10 C-terminal domain-containing protein n=1 Tax=Lipomyces tetrasporus TaxID=54092 RepID=A0AAD7QL35_9ASCO|nr:Sas10 C-terminal domain-containing protein [Lipomyces tetrasporus]KAJ8097280.1 Sas10 C-terminal domain-containing protein [Lipomyces tetrasporus]
MKQNMARAKTPKYSQPTANMLDDLESDEVDAFHDQREKILLNPSSDIRFHDAEASDEEVLAIREADDSENESDVDDEVEYADEEDTEEEHEPPKSSTKNKVSSRRRRNVDANIEDDDEDWRNLRRQYTEEDELSGWGKSARAYYDADEIEDEEDAKEEEETAIKIQQKNLAEMSTSDFLDDFEDEMKDGQALEDAEFTKSIKEAIPQQDISQLSQPDKLELLRSQKPEVFPLAKEYSELVKIHDTLRKSQETAGKLSVKFVALSSYLACICAYFTLYCDTDFDEDDLRNSRIMNHLLVLRRYWKILSQLPDSDNVEDETNSSPDLVHSDEVDEIKEDSISELEDEEDYSFGKLQNRAQESTLSSQSAKRKRPEKTVSLPSDLLDLDLDGLTRLPLSKKKKLNASKTFTENDFADATALDDTDLADKKIKRKSLRFYTSKIDQKAQMRKDRLSGDMDLPYKERDKERQKRLNQLAEQRGQTKAVEGDEDYLDDASDDYNHNDLTIGISKQAGNDGFEDDYYDMVKSSRDQKRAMKEELLGAVKKAARDGKLKEFEETIGEDGKRAINYQILKNKGLTPKRNKDNRNPRVKKRKKYEKAKKKLASMKHVYKAPEGPYSGEKTGIKKNISRSIKFK